MVIDIGSLLPLLLSLGAAFLVSFISTPLAEAFAYKVGAVDVPKDTRRVHDHPIPRCGGLAIFLGFLMGVLWFAELDSQLKGILLGSLIIVAVGVVDDITPLPALLKLVVQVVAAGIAVGFGIRIDSIYNPAWWSAPLYLNLGIFSIPVTIIWIVGITNSVNLIDGLDGLADGVSAIASASMMTICYLMGSGNHAIVLAALVGACLGFMPFNFNPAKIFMGDTGALFLGYVMATLSITGLLKFYTILSFAVPLVALGLPIFDTAFAIIRRLLKGQNPMSPDRGHFHHRLIDMGLSQKQAVAILYSISAILGLSSVLIATNSELRALILLFAFAVAVANGVVLLRGHNLHEVERHAASGEPEEKEDGKKQ